MSINLTLENLYFEDFKEREQAKTSTQLKLLTKNTKIRLNQLRKIIHEIDESEIWNCHYVAYLLHHGDDSTDYKLAHKYAKKAVSMGSSVTKWLYAATLDRYLISIGKKQKFGTQYHIEKGKKVYFESDGTINPTQKIEFGANS